MFDSGLYLIKLPGPPVTPSNTGSTSTTGTALRVPGDWSLRWPVIHAFSVFSCARSGRTCHSVNRTNYRSVSSSRDGLAAVLLQAIVVLLGPLLIPSDQTMIGSSCCPLVSIQRLYC